MDHGEITNIVYDYLMKKNPGGKYFKYYKYALGELDIVRLFQLDVWAYEIKTSNTHKSRRRATEQLNRFHDYLRSINWHCKEINMFYVRPSERNILIENIDGSFLERIVLGNDRNKK